MRPGLAELATWNPRALGTSAAALTDVRSTLDRMAGDTEQSAAWTRRGWDGVGADTAFALIGFAQSDTSRIAALCSELESVLLAAESAVADARDRALEAAAVAAGEGFDVADDGTVTPSAGQLASAGDTDSRRGELESRGRSHTATIQNALSSVDAADLAATSAVDSLCARLYERSSPSSSWAPTLTPPATTSHDPAGPGWEFDPSVDPRTMTASVVIGGMVEATRMGAVNEMKSSPDPVLNKIFGDVGQSIRNPAVRRLLQGVSRAGAVGAVVGAVPSIKTNLDNGMDPATAVGSEVAGAGAGLLAGATAGAIGGAVGGPVGIVGGFIAGAVVGGLAGHFTSKGIQGASRALQEN